MSRSIRLESGEIITLNVQQEAALNNIDKWLNNTLPAPEHPEGLPFLFSLLGYAGTGKTTIIKESIDKWSNTQGRWDRGIAVTAPTHKAKKEISVKTGIEGKTIQSLIGLAPNTDVAEFDINNPGFAIKNRPTIDDYSVIIIDEASMLNTDLFKLLIAQAQAARVKLLFMADRAQLPPVGEELSPTVSSPLLGYVLELTEVERTAKGNPLLPIFDRVRNNITSLSDTFEHVSIVEGEKPDDIGIEFHRDIMKFGGRVVTTFASEQFKENSNYCKVLTWTNDRVKYWNDQIRLSLILNLRKGLDSVELMERVHDQFMLPNELLLSYNSINKSITNSGEYKVLSMDYVPMDVEFGNYVNPMDKSLGRTDKVEINVYTVKLQNVDVEENAFTVNIVEPDIKNYRNFIYAFNFYHNMGVMYRNWPMYYGWKNKFLLLTDIKGANGRMIVKKDLDYGYALSVHKSQGSTFDKVFLDEDNIDKLESRPFVEFLMQQDAAKEKKRAGKTEEGISHYQAFIQKYPTFESYYAQKQKEKNQLKYVAMSRAKKKVTSLTSKIKEVQ